MILNKGGANWQAISLAEVEETGSYMVEGVEGPDNQRLRLSELGIVPGMPVSVLSLAGDGMLVVRINGGRMALSKGTTKCVRVRSKHRAVRQ